MALPDEFLPTVFRIDPPAGGLPAAFAVITAYNPMGSILDEDANSLADEALREDLITRGIPHFRMTGGNEDFSHAEPGWAAEMAFQEAVELGRKFEQLGIWWIERGILHLVDCKDGSCIPLGPLEPRLR
jgi:hypothetical protein